MTMTPRVYMEKHRMEEDLMALYILKNYLNKAISQMSLVIYNIELIKIPSILFSIDPKTKIICWCPNIAGSNILRT